MFMFVGKAEIYAVGGIGDCIINTSHQLLDNGI